MVPPTRPLAARRWWRRLHSLALSLKDGGGAISFPGRSLQWPTRCHGHMCGGDGSIQAHIKACAALRAISVVTAHNTISSGLLASYLEEAQLFYESYCHQYIGSILGL
uniref:Uncharacterized protein n=1 Tax=Oryza rufipogon TaxID=4529 RepID=A0A0E0RH18_ORYRU